MTKLRRSGLAAFVAALAVAGLAAADKKAPPLPVFPPGVEGGYAPVNGLQMYYELHGPKDAATPPLVLLHGGGSTIGTSFAELLPLLDGRSTTSLIQRAKEVTL